MPRTRLIPPPGRGIVGMRNAPARARARARVHPPSLFARLHFERSICSPTSPSKTTSSWIITGRGIYDISALCSENERYALLIRVMGFSFISRKSETETGNRVLYSYSSLLHDLYKKQLLLNRKIPAQIAILNKNCLYMISNKIIK
ncbi:hypothetical protein MUK42_18806 [Musa troglodytarum]|uniref:Large ribosomal subunit protein bL20c n=1 Tax=Musa troglodytarum TaxID=320322 RepID=A0A9E7HFR4_9LILI|nr:hypothetical protein MUK42_18806 [Musa troglodytarum]